ncbi:hypothetical protein O6H91_09G120600 [Diphasiastrum complanatum]|uniref:Uncharacterized protein n=1 Tax=Diphasiastrum complanatum TaxID=34168 RepID=A0ACC2CU22_DIPCM|nr:hypothetical protein O6H91_09G120600 [Diphasiastrum complanatum]
MAAMLSEVKKDRKTKRKEWQGSVRAINHSQFDLAREMRDGLTHLEARFEELETTRGNTWAPPPLKPKDIPTRNTKGPRKTAKVKAPRTFKGERDVRVVEDWPFHMDITSA